VSIVRTDPYFSYLYDAILGDSGALNPPAFRQNRYDVKRKSEFSGHGSNA
jgi:hypothetical protein